MKDYHGGNLFVPPDSRHTLRELVMASIKLLGDDGRIYAVSIPGQDGWQDVPLPTRQGIDEIIHIGRGAIFLPIAGLEGAVYFLEQVYEYRVLGIEVYEDDVNYPGNLSAVNTFVDRWLHFCEYVEVLSGFFYQASGALSQEDFSAKAQALHDQNLPALLESFSANWLTYLNASLATKGQEEIRHIAHEEHIRLQEPTFTMDTLPSGALFVRRSPFAARNRYA